MYQNKVFCSTMMGKMPQNKNKKRHNPPPMHTLRCSETRRLLFQVLSFGSGECLSHHSGGAGRGPGCSEEFSCCPASLQTQAHLQHTLLCKPRGSDYSHLPMHELQGPGLFFITSLSQAVFESI